MMHIAELEPMELQSHESLVKVTEESDMFVPLVNVHGVSAYLDSGME